MMSDHMPDDAIKSAFNDLVRTDLAAPAPECECKCNGAEPHADRLCHKRATVLVALHRWGWCDEAIPADAADPAAYDADGNLTALMCDKCAEWAVAVARRNITKVLDEIPAGGRAECPTCHRVTTRWQDIAERRPL